MHFVSEQASSQWWAKRVWVAKVHGEINYCNALQLYRTL